MYKLEVFTAVCLQYASCAGCPGWHGIRLLPSLWHFLLELCRSNNKGCAAGERHARNLAALLIRTLNMISLLLLNLAAKPVWYFSTQKWRCPSMLAHGSMFSVVDHIADALFRSSIFETCYWINLNGWWSSRFSCGRFAEVLPSKLGLARQSGNSWAAARAAMAIAVTTTNVAGRWFWTAMLPREEANRYPSF
jgi:hypothetical protein